MFSYKYSTYQIIKDPCNEQYQNNISSYGETTDHTKHHTLLKIHLEKYIQVYIDYLFE